MRYNRLCMLAAAIANVSGFFDPLSVAYKHNNPGFFRYESGNLVRFNDKQEGFDHLICDICKYTGCPVRSYMISVCVRFEIAYDDLKYYLCASSCMNEEEIL